MALRISACSANTSCNRASLRAPALLTEDGVDGCSSCGVEELLLLSRLRLLLLRRLAPSGALRAEQGAQTSFLLPPVAQPRECGKKIPDPSLVPCSPVWCKLTLEQQA